MSRHERAIQEGPQVQRAADRHRVAIVVDLGGVDLRGAARADEVLGAANEACPVGPELAPGDPEVITTVMAGEEWHA